MSETVRAGWLHFHDATTLQDVFTALEGCTIVKSRVGADVQRPGFKLAVMIRHPDLDEVLIAALVGMAEVGGIELPAYDVYFRRDPETGRLVRNKFVCVEQLETIEVKSDALT